MKHNVGLTPCCLVQLGI